ncbi:MAG: NAD(P)-dependent oxidoreductase [Solirubrobacterales bacterium]
MSTLIIGGTGFIGRRLVDLLVAEDERVVCLDLTPAPASFERYGSQVEVIRGDVAQFDDVLAATLAAKPSRIVNLAYALTPHAPCHAAFKLNVVGMHNCFEAAHMCEIDRVVFGSSLAASGPQSKHGYDKVVDEDEPRYGTNQYAVHKIFNEEHARDYNEKYGMEVISFRPANVTGVDKVAGGLDHIQCVTFPAAGKAITFPYKDRYHCPIHVEDLALGLSKVVMAEKPRHSIYNSGGTPINLGELADLVRELIPDADISFEHETGAQEISTNYLIDNSRLLEEFDIEYRPYRERVRQMIDEVRAAESVPVPAA